MALLTSELLPTKTYPFSVLRHQSARDPSQEGVWGATDYQVVQRGAGANMSVDVGAGDAWVQGDDAVRQGLYHQVNDATVNVTVGTAHATLPRLDQVVLQMADSSVIGSSDTPALNVVAGTATSGATLDNRTGAGALPNTALRLADILVPAAATSIVTANIRDRRAWARGGRANVSRTTNASGGSNYSITNTSASAFDSANMSLRLECSGVPVKLRLAGRASPPAGANLLLAPAADGSTTPIAAQFSASSNEPWFTIEATYTPTAGSHIFTWLAWVSSGTGQLFAAAGVTLSFTAEEDSRPNANNGTA